MGHVLPLGPVQDPILRGHDPDAIPLGYFAYPLADLEIRSPEDDVPHFRETVLPADDDRFLVCQILG